MKQENVHLCIAIQKSGKLSQSSFELLRKCGLSFFPSERQLICRVNELPIDLFLVRDDDIPSLVNEGVCDLGIVGENVFQEFILSSEKNSLNSILPLNASQCRLSLCTPKDMNYKDIFSLKNKKIATSYPAILSQFLRQRDIPANIVKIHGSVEIAPSLGLADAICDLVSTGLTLESNNLIELETILKCQAILIGKKINSEIKINIFNCLFKRMQGVLAAKETKYVMLNVHKNKLNDIIKYLPGADSPSCYPLADESKVAVHAVCYEPIFWETMEKLKDIGATNILVVPIEKMLT